MHGLFPFGRVSGHVQVGSFVVFGCPSRRVFVAAISARYMVSLRLIIPEVPLNMRYRAYLALHIFLGGGLDVQRRALPRLHVSDVLSLSRPLGLLSVFGLQIWEMGGAS